MYNEPPPQFNQSMQVISICGTVYLEQVQGGNRKDNCQEVVRLVVALFVLVVLVVVWE